MQVGSCRERGGRSEQQGTGLTVCDVERGRRHKTRAEEEAELLKLPPLPDPDRCRMRAQAAFGTLIAVFLIFVCAAPMQLFANMVGVANITFTMRVHLLAIYIEAAIIIVSLLLGMWRDPGTLTRTPDRCFPWPEIVSARLCTGQSLVGLANVKEGARVFCVRCLLWRPASNAHHCSICQRCVVDFDHHCDVLGRCIAGEGCAGNMGYFKTALVTVVLSIATLVSFVLSSGTVVVVGETPQHDGGAPASEPGVAMDALTTFCCWLGGMINGLPQLLQLVICGTLGLFTLFAGWMVSSALVVVVRSCCRDWRRHREKRTCTKLHEQPHK